MPNKEPRKFRSKPKTITAVQYTGCNFDEIERFVGAESFFRDGGVEIQTLEGRAMLASPLDWIIKGVKGEFYPCKPDIFELTYEEL